MRVLTPLPHVILIFAGLNAPGHTDLATLILSDTVRTLSLYGIGLPLRIVAGAVALPVQLVVPEAG